VRVNVFPGGFNWPLFTALETGSFARAGIEVALQATTGSMVQMSDLAAGNFEIAMTGFDNIVAYVEGQGEAAIGPQPEFFAFLGSDDSFLSLGGPAGHLVCGGLARPNGIGGRGHDRLRLRAVRYARFCRLGAG
jgi:hypothetical protein